MWGTHLTRIASWRRTPKTVNRCTAHRPAMRINPFPQFAVYSLSPRSRSAFVMVDQRALSYAHLPSRGYI